MEDARIASIGCCVAVFSKRPVLYDVLGRSVAKTVGGITTTYCAHDLDRRVIEERDGSTWQARCTLRLRMGQAEDAGIDEPLTMEVISGAITVTHYYHGEALGSWLTQNLSAVSSWSTEASRVAVYLCSAVEDKEYISDLARLFLSLAGLRCFAQLLQEHQAGLICLG